MTEQEQDHHDDSRPAFEAWVRSKYRNARLQRFHDKYYTDGNVNRMWQAWKASREAL